MVHDWLYISAANNSKKCFFLELSVLHGLCWVCNNLSWKCCNPFRNIASYFMNHGVDHHKCLQVLLYFPTFLSIQKIHRVGHFGFCSDKLSKTENVPTSEYLLYVQSRKTSIQNAASKSDAVSWQGVIIADLLLMYTHKSKGKQNEGICLAHSQTVVQRIWMECVVMFIVTCYMCRSDQTHTTSASKRCHKIIV